MTDPQPRAFPRIQRAIAAPGHLALWAALYITAAVVCAAQLIGAPAALEAPVLLFAWSTAALAYLLDRVKLRDAWLDPADRIAHPRRYAFLIPRSRGVRALMLGMGLLSAVSGWLLHPLAVLATLATVAGVFVYAGLPRRGAPRVKDRFLLKNLFVSAGIASFAIIVVLVAAARPANGMAPRLERFTAAHAWAAAFAFAHLFLRVYADSVLCDIDDEPADRAHDTRTLPTRVGPDRAWRIAMWLRLALAASLLVWPAGPWPARLWWAVLTAVSTIGLRLWRPRAVRDLVDARFALEALCVAALLRAA